MDLTVVDLIRWQLEAYLDNIDVRNCDAHFDLANITKFIQPMINPSKYDRHSCRDS